jgi:hypothetical protein
LTFLLALVTLILLRLTERWIHLHLQLIGHRLTGSETAALSIYAIIFFPGVVLHELSHWLFAKLCGVRTGRISLLPSVGKTGNLHLGSVEYSAAGLAPCCCSSRIICLEYQQQEPLYQAETCTHCWISSALAFELLISGSGTIWLSRSPTP